VTEIAHLIGDVLRVVCGSAGCVEVLIWPF